MRQLLNKAQRAQKAPALHTSKAQRFGLRTELIRNLNIFRYFKRARRDASDATYSDLQTDLASAPGPEQDANPKILSQTQKTPARTQAMDADVHDDQRRSLHVGAAAQDDSVDDNFVDDETENRWRFDGAEQSARRRLPARVQVSMLGLVLVALWWSWPLWASANRPFVAAPTAGLSGETDAPESAATRASLQTLAIINPENLPRPEQATLHSTGDILPEDAPAGHAPPPTVSAENDAEQETGSVVTIISSDESPAPVNSDADIDDDSPAAVAPDDGSVGDDRGHAAEQASAEANLAEDARDDHAETRLEHRVIVAAGASSDDNRLPDDDFPEVGQADPDALSPFMVEVDIPDAAASDAMSTLPAVASQPVAVSNNGVPADLILLPTATPVADAERLEAQAANLPRVEIIPAIGAPVTPTPEPSPTITPTPTPTPIPSAAGRGRLWSTFMPQPAPDNDHYWIGNPFTGISANHSASPSYQFGSTAGNRYRPHHGLDISNPPGTPVRAGVVGQVVHAGPDDPELLGPYNNFYGNTVVILLDQRLPVAGGELDVYLLYGHLSEVRTEVDERVGPDDIVGLVGMTGIAIGPHLHVEVRLGANTYDHSVNPYLWLEPPPGSGTVAVRILTAGGHTWAGSKVSIARFEGGAAVWARQIETYLDTENIGPDPAWGENGAMGDVPAGHYHLIGSVNGENIRAEFTVNAGETTFIEVRTQE